MEQIKIQELETSDLSSVLSDNNISEDLKKGIKTEIGNNEDPQKVAAKIQKIKEIQEQEIADLMNLTYVTI